MSPAKWRLLLALVAVSAIVIFINVRARRNVKNWCLEAYAVAHTAADSAAVDSQTFWTGIERHPSRLTCRDLVRPAFRLPN